MGEWLTKEAYESRTGYRCRGEHNDGFICTLTRGHEGDHVAHGLGNEVVKRWSVEPKRVADAIDPTCECEAPVRRAHADGPDAYCCVCGLDVDGPAEFAAYDGGSPFAPPRRIEHGRKAGGS